MFYMHSVGWGWWLVMSIGMVSFWVLLSYGIVWLIRAQNPQQHDEPSVQTPRQVLERRLAAGEISIEEYWRLLQVLDDQPPRHSMAA